MKKTLLLFVFLVFSAYPQQFGIGFTGDFLTGNTNISYQIGPTAFLNYKFDALPISLRADTRFYYGNLNSEGFSADYTYTDLSLGASVNYYPITWHIEPYFSAGMFYNANYFSKNGNQTPLSDGYLHLLDNARNSISFELTAGLKFATETPINFLVEVTQTFNTPVDYVLSEGEPSYKIIKRTNLNFNSLILKLGLLFRI